MRLRELVSAAAESSQFESSIGTVYYIILYSLYRFVVLNGLSREHIQQW